MSCWSLTNFKTKAVLCYVMLKDNPVQWLKSIKETYLIFPWIHLFITYSWRWWYLLSSNSRSKPEYELRPAWRLITLHRYTGTLVNGYDCTSTQIYKYTGTRIHSYTATWVHGYTDTDRHTDQVVRHDDGPTEFSGGLSSWSGSEVQVMQIFANM